MYMSKRIPQPYQTQIDLHHRISNSSKTSILAVELHNVKFDQNKALSEHQSTAPLDETLPDTVYDRSQRMVEARGADGTSVSVDEAWSAISKDETWIGSLPVQIYRSYQDVYLRGYPYLIGFVDGEPRVILNKILPNNPKNKNKFYANEWARPWVIAEILDATGFTTDNLILATMKAVEPADGKTDESKVLPFVYQIAKRTVNILPEVSEEAELTPCNPVKPNFSYEPDYISTQIISYETEYPLINQLDHGDSIREIIEMFQGKREPKGTPPDRGLTLPCAVKRTTDPRV